jgi:hypothetical protein
MAKDVTSRPAILDGSHSCDVYGEHRNDDCNKKPCVCTLCGTFWHWNIWHWERAHGRAV